MKLKNSILFLFLLFGTCAFSQDLNASNFVLDHSKPYVYLKFDHIGPRKMHQAGEEDLGLWLKVVNNCRIPISFRASGGYPGEPGVALEDEVVEEEQGLQIIADGDFESFIKERKRRLERLRHKPEGYSYEVSGVVTVQPGKDILFSVPLNHVDEFWFMRIKFAFDLNGSSVAVGPFTYLPFYKWDIPKDGSDLNSSSQQPMKK
jgi:hypothetical protein